MRHSHHSPQLTILLSWAPPCIATGYFLFPLLLVLLFLAGHKCEVCCIIKDVICPLVQVLPMFSLLLFWASPAVLCICYPPRNFSVRACTLHISVWYTALGITCLQPMPCVLQQSFIFLLNNVWQNWISTHNRQQYAPVLEQDNNPFLFLLFVYRVVSSHIHIKCCTSETIWSEELICCERSCSCSFAETTKKWHGTQCIK